MGPVLDWKNAGTVNPSTNTVSIDSGDGFGDMYAMDDQQTRLPIVLLSFMAQVNGSRIQLKWSTASELDNDYFTIERSSNGTDFEPILYVPGKGTSEENNIYVAIDDSPISGRSYYRLKQTDFNGTFDYSEMVSVVYGVNGEFSFGLKVNSINAGEKLGVWFKNVVGIPRFMIRDIRGKMVMDKTLSPEITEIEETGQLSAGIYFLTVNHFGKMKTKKFVVR